MGSGSIAKKVCSETIVRANTTNRRVRSCLTDVMTTREGTARITQPWIKEAKYTPTIETCLQRPRIHCQNSVSSGDYEQSYYIAMTGCCVRRRTPLFFSTIIPQNHPRSKKEKREKKKFRQLSSHLLADRLLLRQPITGVRTIAINSCSRKGDASISLQRRVGRRHPSKIQTTPAVELAQKST